MSPSTSGQSWIGRHRHRGNDMTAATGMLIVAPFDGIAVDATNHSAQRREGHRRSTATCTRRIGFYRNMTTADAAAAGVAIGYSMVGRDQLPAVWVLFFLAAAVLFAYRYRRFWRRFGDGVVPGMRTLPPK
jgi:hypothetical protein